MSIEIVLFVLVAAVALIGAGLIGIAAGILAWLGESNVPNSILRAGVAFGGALTLVVAIVGLLGVLLGPPNR